MKKSIFMIVMFCLCLLCACGKTDVVEVEGSESDSLEFVSVEESSTEVLVSESPSVIFVHVCGQVNSPAVYEFESGARVVEAIEMAGGFTDAASTDFLNLAQVLTDGEKLYVPSNEEALELESSVNVIGAGEGTKVLDTKVNINTASKEELLSLKGIGDSRAEDIISYRNEYGSFAAIEDIMKVPGIKQGAFNKIKDSIKVE